MASGASKEGKHAACVKQGLEIPNRVKLEIAQCCNFEMCVSSHWLGCRRSNFELLILKSDGLEILICVKTQELDTGNCTLLQFYISSVQC